MLRLAEYSRVALAAVREDSGLSYDGRMQGTLQLFRTQRQLDASAKDVESLSADGIPYEVLDRDGCIRIEPALRHARDRIVGGLRTPKDETGDCFKFSNALEKRAAGLGVTFRYGQTIEGLQVEGGQARGVVTNQGFTRSDAIVVALGSYSPLLLRKVGINLPVYPIKGYSLTIPIEDASRAPESTVMDETYKVAITRLGERIRVGGMAEVSGYSNDLSLARRRTLEHSVMNLFPGGNPKTASLWSGLRPMTPDGPPIIGPTKIRNLFLNTGHGTLGWTMSCGSARIIADLISGRRPDIETVDLELSRYR